MKTDPLREHLEREALAERPAFSEQRHQQLLAQLRAPKPIPTTWFPRAVAAALILTAILLTTYALSHRTSPAPIVKAAPTPLQPLAVSPSAPEIPLISINFANILSLNAWPPSITTLAPQPDTNVSSPPPNPPPSIGSSINSNSPPPAPTPPSPHLSPPTSAPYSPNPTFNPMTQSPDDSMTQ